MWEEKLKEQINLKKMKALCSLHSPPLLANY